MEIFHWHEGLNKYVEIGNSGMFRPEMLRPMGFPEVCIVCTMFLYICIIYIYIYMYIYIYIYNII